jgi:hypothetical protein
MSTNPFLLLRTIKANFFDLLQAILFLEFGTFEILKAHLLILYFCPLHFAEESNS